MKFLSLLTITVSLSIFADCGDGEILTVYGESSVECGEPRRKAMEKAKKNAEIACAICFESNNVSYNVIKFRNLEYKSGNCGSEGFSPGGAVVALDFSCSRR